jgi:hypothetical protein
VLAIDLDGDGIELTLRERVNSGLRVVALASAIEPLVAGLASGLLVWAAPAARSDLEHAGKRFREFREQPTPELQHVGPREHQDRDLAQRERLQLVHHPLTSYVIAPLFAPADAGIASDADFLERAAAAHPRGGQARHPRHHSRRGCRHVAGVPHHRTAVAAAPYSAVLDGAVNGRRHHDYGAYDTDAPSRAVRAAGARAQLPAASRSRALPTAGDPRDQAPPGLAVDQMRPHGVEPSPIGGGCVIRAEIS